MVEYAGAFVFGAVVVFLFGEAWRNVTEPNLRCRWLGHATRMQDGWAYCERCKWREPLLPLPREA